MNYRGLPIYEPRYNIAPTDTVPILKLADGQRQISPMSWGTIPKNKRGIQQPLPWSSPHLKQSANPGGWPNIIYGVGTAAPTASTIRTHPPGSASSKKGR
jgi:hypothetical protein